MVMTAKQEMETAMTECLKCLEEDFLDLPTRPARVQLQAANLTFEKLARAMEAMEMCKPKVHYIADGRCPELDKNGNAIFFYLKSLNVLVLHPDNLPVLATRSRLVELDRSDVTLWTKMDQPWGVDYGAW